MEQHTWPRGSGYHAFSALSASYYDNRLERRQQGHPRARGGTQPLESGEEQQQQATHVIKRRQRCSGSGKEHDEDDDEDVDDDDELCEGHVPYRDHDRSGKSCTHTRRDIDRKRALPLSINGLDFVSYGRLSCSERTENGFRRKTVPLIHSIHQCSLSENRRPGHGHDTSQEATRDFAQLPDDILRRIAGCFSWPNLWSASRVCRPWSQALAPLREAMLFVHWGKKFKHGRGGVARNLTKALDSFLKGAVRGCAAAMVDAGLLLWEMDRRQEGMHWYRRAADLGDPAGQCNLGLAYLQEPSNPTEAVKWFQRAAIAGHVRAQYSLALCLQQGKGTESSAVKAAHWYQRAAHGGSARAMYNLALCYKRGEGISGDLRAAKKWMRRAAYCGHRKAQFEHGVMLFSESKGGDALVFLELATRAGETAATHLRDALLQQLSPNTRACAITRADKWQARLIARH